MLNCTNGINEIGYSEYWYITNSKIISGVLFSYNLYVKISMSKEKKSMQ